LHVVICIIYSTSSRAIPLQNALCEALHASHNFRNSSLRSVNIMASEYPREINLEELWINPNDLFIGRGGYGFVYKAYHKYCGVVAAKVAAARSPAALELFKKGMSINCYLFFNSFRKYAPLNLWMIVLIQLLSVRVATNKTMPSLSYDTTSTVY